MVLGDGMDAVMRRSIDMNARNQVVHAIVILLAAIFLLKVKLSLCLTN
jgi:hypothetical protein